MPVYRRIYIPRPEWLESAAPTRYGMVVKASRSLIEDASRTPYFTQPYEFTGEHRKGIVFELPVTDQDEHWRDAATNALIKLQEGQGTHTYDITVSAFRDYEEVATFTIEGIGLPSSKYSAPVNVFDLMPLRDGEGEVIYPPAGWENLIRDAVQTTTENAESARTSAAQAESASIIAQGAASDAQRSEEAASGSASAAQIAASNSQSAAVQARASADDASDSAADAGASAATAEAQATVASDAATDAGQSASNAATSETNAAGSASDANLSAVAADDSADAAEDAADRAEAAAEQVDTRRFASVRPTGTQPSSGTFSTLDWTTISSTGFDPNFGSLTVQSAGLYLFTVSMRLPSVTSGNFSVALRINGTTQHVFLRQPLRNGVSQTYPASHAMPLAVGDDITFVMWQGSGADMDIDSNSIITVTKISA